MDVRPLPARAPNITKAEIDAIMWRGLPDYASLGRINDLDWKVTEMKFLRNEARTRIAELKRDIKFDQGSLFGLNIRNEWNLNESRVELKKTKEMLITARGDLDRVKEYRKQWVAATNELAGSEYLHPDCLTGADGGGGIYFDQSRLARVDQRMDELFIDMRQIKEKNIKLDPLEDVLHRSKEPNFFRDVEKTGVELQGDARGTIDKAVDKYFGKVEKVLDDHVFPVYRDLKRFPDKLNPLPQDLPMRPDEIAESKAKLQRTYSKAVNDEVSRANGRLTLYNRHLHEGDVRAVMEHNAQALAYNRSAADVAANRRYAAIQQLKATKNRNVPDARQYTSQPISDHALGHDFGNVEAGLHYERVRDAANQADQLMVFADEIKVENRSNSFILALKEADPLGGTPASEMVLPHPNSAMEGHVVGGDFKFFRVHREGGIMGHAAPQPVLADHIFLHNLTDAEKAGSYGTWIPIGDDVLKYLQDVDPVRFNLMKGEAGANGMIPAVQDMHNMGVTNDSHLIAADLSHQMRPAAPWEIQSGKADINIPWPGEDGFHAGISTGIFKKRAGLYKPLSDVDRWARNAFQNPGEAAIAYGKRLASRSRPPPSREIAQALSEEILSNQPAQGWVREDFLGRMGTYLYHDQMALGIEAPSALRADTYLSRRAFANMMNGQNFIATLPQRTSNILARIRANIARMRGNMEGAVGRSITRAGERGVQMAEQIELKGASKALGISKMDAVFSIVQVGLQIYRDSDDPAKVALDLGLWTGAMGGGTMIAVAAGAGAKAGGFGLAVAGQALDIMNIVREGGEHEAEKIAITAGVPVAFGLIGMIGGPGTAAAAYGIGVIVASIINGFAYGNWAESVESFGDAFLNFLDQTRQNRADEAALEAAAAAFSANASSYTVAQFSKDISEQSASLVGPIAWRVVSSAVREIASKAA